MLKQILRDMYVDPEILAGLDETYKQTLFCKMREEQVRRWRIWDEKQQKMASSKSKDSNKNRIKRHVDFRVGDDGEPWVWVMGEHPDDLSIEEILEREAKDKARQLAEKEFRKSVEAQLSDIIDFDNKKNKINEADLETPKIEDMEIYCSVDELKERMKPQIPQHINEIQHNAYNNRLNTSPSNRTNKIDVLQEITYNRPKPSAKIAARIAQWEQRTIGQRTTEIFKQIQQKKQETVKEAEEAARKVEEHWREQERKAKEAEVQMREIARRAREEHRKSILDDNSTNSSPAASLDIAVPRPPNQEAVVQWYRNTEFPKRTGIDPSGKLEKWFHGLLNRNDAEAQLANEEQGTFLVRISEKIWGYAISYKDVDRYKHYLVDASNGKYQFLGQNQLTHNSLSDLLKYHSTVPITILGNELLLRSCSNNGHIPAVLEGLV